MPLLHTLHTPFGAEVLIWRNDETETELRTLLPPLSPEAEAELQRRALDKRRREYLLARLLLNRLLGQPGEIGYTGDGRPYLPGREAALSISHSGPYVAVALHPGSDIGIDLECNGPKASRLRNRFLSPAEIARLPTPAETAVLLAWSGKESLYKALAIPGIDFQKQFETRFDAIGAHGAFHIRQTARSPHTDHALHYTIYPRFVFTGCALPSRK